MIDGCLLPYTAAMPSRWASLGTRARAALALPALVLTAIVAGGLARPAESSPAERSVPVHLDWQGYRDAARLERTAEGPRYHVVRDDGQTETLTPEDFARLAIDHESARSAVERALNVTGPVGIAWVLFGLLGQVVFMGRMVVQWLVSERSKRSIVPPTFWFMSLVGSVMLLTYFIWRWDIVGMLGQSLGTVIYVRNIMLIRRHQRSDGAAACDEDDAETTREATAT